MWGISTVGSALRWQRRGHRFEPGMLHTNSSIDIERFLVRPRSLYYFSQSLFCRHFADQTTKLSVF